MRKNVVWSLSLVLALVAFASAQSFDRLNGSLSTQTELRSGSTTDYTFMRAPSGGVGFIATSSPQLALGAASADRWRIDTSGHLWPTVNGSTDIGLSSNKIRNFYVSGTVFTADVSLGSSQIRLITTEAPSAPSACGTSPSISANNGTAAFRVTVGTGGTANTCTWTMPTSITGWNCFVTDITTRSATVFLQKQTAGTATSVTVGNFDAAGAAAAFTASDVLAVSCFSY